MNKIFIQTVDVEEKIHNLFRNGNGIRKNLKSLSCVCNLEKLVKTGSFAEELWLLSFSKGSQFASIYSPSEMIFPEDTFIKAHLKLVSFFLLRFLLKSSNSA